ncbi:MAG: NB-ARC domain-containing protein, partial [Candidatus Dormibacteraeota bacterium]|nr:NB-ARC domain-containing protein [Candidatus Dormibacteraeota bacterium]
MGCAAITLQKLESGARRPSRQIALLLARYFGVPPDEQEAFITFARALSASDSAPAWLPSATRGAPHVPWEPSAPAQTHTPWRGAHLRKSNLPNPPTALIGRAREAAAVAALLRGPATALVTLSGPGGMGKTRLALQVAADLRAVYTGIWVVELATLTDPALVMPAIAQTLGVQERGNTPITDTLRGYLKDQHLLLVLDNFEQVVTAGAEVATLLRAVPGVQILITSRQPLGVAGETVWRVPPLTVPDPRLPATPARLAESAAVQLFLDRARLKRPAFALTDENAAAVAALCIRLDGLPLAIELAAARVNVLSVPQIVARLDARFRFLTTSDPTMPRRHQSLQAALDSSYALLSDAEAELLRALSVFAGGCTFEAAWAVAGGTGDEYTVLDMLARLVDQSWVQMEEQDGAARYRLLETVRQYAADTLLAAGEAPAIRTRHREWALAFVEQAEPALWGPDQAHWLNRLDTEHDNLRTALQRVGEDGAVETGLQLAAALHEFWLVRGHYTEGRRRLEDLLSQSASGWVIPG